MARLRDLRVNVVPLFDSAKWRMAVRSMKKGMDSVGESAGRIKGNIGDSIVALNNAVDLMSKAADFVNGPKDSVIEDSERARIDKMLVTGLGVSAGSYEKMKDMFLQNGANFEDFIETVKIFSSESDDLKNVFNENFGKNNGVSLYNESDNGWQTMWKTLDYASQLTPEQRGEMLLPMLGGSGTNEALSLIEAIDDIKRTQGNFSVLDDYYRRAGNANMESAKLASILDMQEEDARRLRNMNNAAYNGGSTNRFGAVSEIERQRLRGDANRMDSISADAMILGSNISGVVKKPLEFVGTGMSKVAGAVKGISDTVKGAMNIK